MIKLGALFNFAVNCVLAHDSVVLFQFEAFSSVLTILLRYITGSAGKATGFMLSAFHDYLDAVAFAFLCHTVLAYELVVDTGQK
jgi:hypothetical protein